MPRKGDEKLKELEEIMMDSGLFNEDFSVGGIGDVAELSEEEGRGRGDRGDGEHGDGKNEEDPKDSKKKKGDPFPPIEGQESCKEFVTKYKRSLLNRRQAFREALDKWDEEKPKSGMKL